MIGRFEMGDKQYRIAADDSFEECDVIKGEGRAGGSRRTSGSIVQTVRVVAAAAAEDQT